MEFLPISIIYPLFFTDVILGKKSQQFLTSKPKLVPHLEINDTGMGYKDEPLFVKKRSLYEPI